MDFKRIGTVFSLMVALLFSVGVSADDVSSSGTIDNDTPTITQITISGNQSADTYNPVENNSRAITWTANVTDANGIADIDDSNLTCAFGTNPDSVSSESQTISKTITSYSAQNTKNVQCDYNLRYYDEATTYDLYINASDGSGLTANDTHQITYSSLSAFALKESTLAFGSGSVTTYLKPNTDVGVWNTGNQQVDTNVNGTDMTGPDTITVDNITWDTTYSAAQSAYSNTLTTSPAAFIVTLARGYLAEDSAYFGLFLPSGTSSGAYTGTISILSQ